MEGSIEDCGMSQSYTAVVPVAQPIPVAPNGYIPQDIDSSAMYHGK